MMINEEQIVDRTTLNEFIKKATMEETKQLKLQIHHLYDKIATINNNTNSKSKTMTTRGNGSASSKKKSPKTSKASSPSP
eukprot:6536222-Ditylum_brightwellii.AAC.1